MPEETNYYKEAKQREAAARQEIAREEASRTSCEVEEIVDEDDEPVIEELDEAPLPAVRQHDEKKQEMPFTERKHAHLPARESQLKEPPYPKSKKMDKKKDDVFVDIEDKDPVWLKDKGDHFFGRADYNAACNAYTKALNEDR